MAMHTLPAGERYDWWRILHDLERCGVSLKSIVEATDIPKSTLLGYKNLDAEPKHADGTHLLALWVQHMCPALPVKKGSTRIRRVERRPARNPLAPAASSPWAVSPGQASRR